MGIIYLPVPTAEMRSVVAKWNTGRLAKNKPAHQIIQARGTGIIKAARRIKFGALRNVAAGEKMYVLIHGLKQAKGFASPAVAVGVRRGARRGPGQVPKWDGGTMKDYDPDQLARHLDEEGLTHTFQDLRLFACAAGVPVDAQIPSFAQRLKQALTARGFANVTVSGYLGNLSADYTHALRGEDDEAHEEMPSYTAQRYKTVATRGGDARAKSGRVQF